MALWTLAEQQRIKPFDRASELKFNQIQQEVEQNDLPRYVGYEFYQELQRNKAAYTTLLDGGTYSYNSTTYTFNGLKYVCAYLWYARYIRQSYINDTFSGMVAHTGEGFQRISSGEIKEQEARYEQIAGQYWEDCLRYICTLNLIYFPQKSQTKNKINAL